MTGKFAAFEGQPDGTVLTSGGAGNSDDNGDDQASASIYSVAGGNLTYSTEQKHSGSASLKVTNTSAAIVVWGYTSSPADAATYRARFYLYIGTMPTATIRPFAVTSSGGSTLVRFQISSSGQMQLIATGTATGASSLSAGQWYRIEHQGTGLNSSSGAFSCQVYSGPDDTGAPYTTMSLTAQTTSALGSQYRLGVVAAPASSSGVVMYFDDVASEFGSSTPFGPILPNATVTPAVVSAAVVQSVPAVLASATVTPAAVARPVVVPTVALSTGSVLTPAAVALSVVVPPPTTSGAATVTPAAIARAVVLPTPSLVTFADGVVAPATVQGYAAIPTFAGMVSSTITVATVAGITTLFAPTPSGAATVRPAAIARAVVISAPIMGSGITVLPAAVTGPAAIPSPTPHEVLPLSVNSLSAWQGLWDDILSADPNLILVGGDGVFSVTHPDGRGAIFAFGNAPLLFDGGATQVFARGALVRWTMHDAMQVVSGRGSVLPDFGDGTWYRPGPMITSGVGGQDLYVFATRQGIGDLPWESRGRSLWRMRWLHGWEAPRLVGKVADLGAGTSIAWGAAAASDGNFIYILGAYQPASAPANRLYLARATEGTSEIADPTSWQFWTNAGWVGDPASLDDPTNLRGVLSETPGAESSMSLNFDGAGTWRMSSKRGGPLASPVSVWEASSVTGPWTPRDVASAPYATPNSNSQTYFGHAHYNLPLPGVGRVLIDVSRSESGHTQADYFASPTWHRPLWSDADATLTRIMPTAIAGTAAVPEVVVGASYTITPTAISRTVVVGTVTVTASTAVQPAVIAAIAGLPSAGMQVGTTWSGTTVATRASVPAPAFGGGTTVTAAPITTAAVLPVARVLITATPTPATVTAVVAAPAAILTGSVAVAVSAVTAVAAIPSDALVTAAAGGETHPACVTATVDVPAPTVVTNALVTPTPVAVTARIPTPGNATNITVEASAIRSNGAVPTPRRVGRPSRRGFVISIRVRP